MNNMVFCHCLVLSWSWLCKPTFLVVVVFVFLKSTLFNVYFFFFVKKVQFWGRFGYCFYQIQWPHTGFFVKGVYTWSFTLESWDSMFELHELRCFNEVMSAEGCSMKNVMLKTDILCFRTKRKKKERKNFLWA